jgi:hypothetical protein
MEFFRAVTKTANGKLTPFPSLTTIVVIGGKPVKGPTLSSIPKGGQLAL